jgi:hypothetical protein
MILVAPHFCHRFDILDNHIKGAPIIDRLPHMIIDFFSAIQTEDNIVHGFIEIFPGFSIKQYPIGGHCKFELLIVFGGHFIAIHYQLFDHIQVHQRLSAEEIHFQVFPVFGLGNDKINGFFSHFQRHQQFFAVKVALGSKTIGTFQITVMGHMKTQGFDQIFISIVFSLIVHFPE